MTSRIIVNNIQSDAGVSTVFFNSDIGGTSGTLNVDGNLNVDGVITYEDVTSVDSVGIITAQSGIHVTSGSVGVGTTNPQDILHVYGTATNFTALAAIESSAQNDGILQISGPNIFSGAGVDHLDLGQNANGATVTADSTGSGSNHLIFQSTSNGITEERLRIKSDGKVGINCTPLAQFQVKTGTNANIALTADGSEASIEAFNDAGSASVPLRIRGSEIKFKIDGTQRARLSYSSSSAVLSLGDESNSAGHLRFEAKASENQIHGRSNHPITFLINTAEKLRIHSGGEVTKPNNPAFLAGRTGGNQTFTLGTFPLNVARLNVGNHYNTSTYKFVAPVAGVYYFYGQVYYNNGTGTYRVGFRKTPNGGSALMLNTAQLGVTGNDNQQNVSIIESLAVGDTVELYSDQNASIQCYYNINASNYGAHTYFMGYLLG